MMVTDITVAAFFFYFLCSSAYTGLLTINNHFAHPKGSGLNINLAYSVTKTHVVLLGAGILLLFLKEKVVYNIFRSVEYLLLANILMTFLPKKWTEFSIESKERKAPIFGMGANTSVNATLTSLMVPFILPFFPENPLWYGTILILALLSILKARASVGAGAFVASLFVYFSFYFDFSFYYFLYFGLTFLVFLFIADVLMRRAAPITNGIFYVSGRNHIYSFAKNNVWNNANKFLGIGAGAFEYLMPTIQTEALKQGKDKNNMATYCWLHSDIGQVIIEGGWVGFALAAIAFLASVWMCFQNHNWVGLSFLAAYFVNSAVNFPNHLAPDCFLVLVMLKYIYL